MVDIFDKRSRVVKYFFGIIFLILVGRLVHLQIFQYKKYDTIARQQHQDRLEIPAQRGKILVRKNMLLDEYIPLATNNTLKDIAVDPLILNYPEYTPREPLESQQDKRGNPQKVAELLAPLLVNAHCDVVEGCELSLDPEEQTPTQKKIIERYQKELERIFSEIYRREVLLAIAMDDLLAEQIRELDLPGIMIRQGNLLADPTRILNVSDTAAKLAPFLSFDKGTLEGFLQKKYNRYQLLAKKVSPEVVQKIQELKSKKDSELLGGSLDIEAGTSGKDSQFLLKGIVLDDKQWRYYPERTLGAQIIGFVNNKGVGQYGIEGRFNDLLAGKKGVISGAKNTQGLQILGKDSEFTLAEDGADIVLSIDRVIQGQVERILAEDTQRFEADAGQIVVVEPKTGRILAMAHYPTFDPNEYTKVFSRYEISEDKEIADREDETFNQRIPTIEDNGKFFRYFNLWGPRVFRNRIVSDTYEPGSVLKAITMASAINAQEVTPQTTYDDTGPIEVDGFKIRNADESYEGKTTMVSVLSRSLNTGIAFITRKMGAQLLYTYFNQFGFGEYTDIDLEGEAFGKLDYWENWRSSELITRGFGQGITTTPLQMAMAFSVLANEGYLMRPLLVEEIHHSDGRIEKIMPETIRRVISNETYNTMKAMLLNVVDQMRIAQVPGYTVMGKSGTSQTYRNGEAQEGLGTTIASFAGFGPLKEPRFVVLVKYDYPKTSQWGSETAGVTFRKVADFLFQHLGVPPDR